MIDELACSSCGARADPPEWQCARCGSPLDLALPPVDPETLVDPVAAGVWRYRGWLPPVEPVGLGEPTTALVDIDVAGRRVAAKLEGALPTGSFKDRGSAVLVAWLRARGARELIVDSSGNAGASMAAYAARAGLPIRVFVPADASPAKLLQVHAVGADVVMVEGSRAASGEAAQAAIAAASDGLAYASHLWQPAFIAGTATFAYETWEALGRRAPDVVVAPLGGGTLLLGVALGFRRLRQAGLIERLPRLVGVQAAACAPLVDPFVGGAIDAHPADPGPSMAEGIRIARPPRTRGILAAVRETGGTIIAVDEDEIGAAVRGLLGAGIFVEPTSAAAAAGTSRLVADGTVADGESVVVALTGHGLKAASMISRLLEETAPPR